MYPDSESWSSSRESRFSSLLFQDRSRIMGFRRGGLIEEWSPGDKYSMKMQYQGGEEKSELRESPG